MLKYKRSINKNVRGCRLQAGIIFGSNPKSATKWRHQTRGPTSPLYNCITLFINNGFWGVQNAKKSAFRHHTFMGS